MALAKDGETTPGTLTDGASEALEETGRREEDTFKKLITDFVLGRNDNPDNAPGLRFYVVFGALLGLALLGVALVGAFLSLVNFIRDLL